MSKIDRRKFLRGAAALPVIPLAAAIPAVDKSPMRIRSGTEYIAAIVRDENGMILGVKK